MKYLIVIILSLFLFSVMTNFVYSQKSDSPKTGMEGMQYKIQPKFVKNTYRSYKLSEVTKVTRQLSDSSTKSYTRDCLYYMTIRVPDNPVEGFQKVVVTLDSLLYKFTDDTLKIEYFTQDEKKRPPRSFDFEATSVPLNRQFNMTYSPYGEVAKIESDEFTALREYMEDQGPKLKKKDEMKNFIWHDGIVDSRLINLTEIKKLIFPNYALPLDSIWKTPFAIQIDYKDYYDTVKAKIAEYNGGNYTIEATSENLKPVKRESYFYYIPKTGIVDSCKGGGLVRISLNPRGIITKVEEEFYLKNFSKIEEEIFTEKVEVKCTWDYLGQFAM